MLPELLAIILTFLSDNDKYNFSICNHYFNDIFREYVKPTKEQIVKSFENSKPDNTLISLINNKYVSCKMLDDLDVLRYIVKENKLELLKTALKKGALPNIDNNFAIKCASDKGHYEIVKVLLNDARVDPSANNNYAIGFAAGNGHYEIVKLLMSDKRVDPSANNNYAISFAAGNDHYVIVKLLMSDKRVDPSADNNYAIRWASYNGHYEIVKLLMSDKRVDPSDDDNCAIRYAAFHKHHKVVDLLMTDERVRLSYKK